MEICPHEAFRNCRGNFNIIFLERHLMSSQITISEEAKCLNQSYFFGLRLARISYSPNYIKSEMSGCGKFNVKVERQFQKDVFA